jgi:DNA-binding protein H-NS
MLKRFKIDGRMQEVFVLRQTENRIVYVPVKSMHRVDYERFKEMSAQKPPRVDLLDYMAKYKLKNGVNALVQYDKIIHVANVHNEIGTRVKKTEEIIDKFEHMSNTNQEPQPKRAVEPQQVNEPVAQQVAVQHLQDVTTGDDEKPVYQFTNKHGKLQQWFGQGRVPDFLKDHIEAGGDIEDYRLK